jgi:ABC-type multidrug transport system fused ATPase/permease subunit
MSKFFSKEKLEKISDEQEENLKLLNTKNLTQKEVIIKSIKLSLKNWKVQIFIQVSHMILHFFSLYLPIKNGNLIDVVISSKNIEQIKSAFLKYIFFIIIQFFIQSFIYLINFFINSHFKQNSQFLLLENILEKDISFFETYKTGEIISKICNTFLDTTYFFKFFTLLQYGAKMALMFGYLYRTSSKLTMVFLTTFLFKMGFNYLSKYILNSQNSKELQKYHIKYSNKLHELLNNIRMIKTFTREKEEMEKLKYYKDKATHKVNIETEIFKNFRTLCDQASDAITLFFLGKFILEGQCTLGDYTIFKQYKSEFSMTWLLITTTFQSFKSVITNWESFFELYDYPVKIRSLKNYISKNLKGKIKFENVTFSYPLKPNSNILSNLSFDIKPGKIFAICGISGSGKTTISNLLERFYDPNEGTIYIDDIDIRDYNIEYLRKNIGFVSQEPILNSGTIEENILYGVDNYKKKDLEEVLKLSNVDTFINDKNKFPDGLKTLVGERGAKISAGQKQRIAIARALMKKSKILIFDEATSALDTKSESELQKAIDNIAKQKEITIIIIAHRLSTVINADTIAVLNNGKFVEIGNHKELINKNGEYTNLFQKQFVNF